LENTFGEICFVLFIFYWFYVLQFCKYIFWNKLNFSKYTWYNIKIGKWYVVNLRDYMKHLCVDSGLWMKCVGLCWRNSAWVDMFECPLYMEFCYFTPSTHTPFFQHKILPCIPDVYTKSLSNKIQPNLILTTHSIRIWTNLLSYPCQSLFLVIGPWVYNRGREFP
jgi:hypothetical protein